MQRVVYGLKASNKNRDIINAYRREYSDIFSQKAEKGRKEYTPDKLSEMLAELADKQSQQELTRQSLHFCSHE